MGGAAAAVSAAPPQTPAPWESLPAFVWRSPSAEGPLPDSWVRDFGGVNVEGPAEARELREQGLVFYVGHAPGRDDLHLERDSGSYPERWSEWVETRDTSLLVRDPCLTDPATRRRLHGALGRTLAARGGEHGLGVSLGDEVSLTPWGDPVDLCRSPTCEAAWRRRVGSSAGDAPAPPFPSTDAARLALSKGELAELGPWLERRRFHQDVVLELLGELAREVRETAPGTPVGLLGLTGQTAFGGVAVERILPELDFLEAYATRNARELLFTLRRPEQRALATVILADGTAASAAWQVWEHWLRGGDGWILYSAGELARGPEHADALRRSVAGARAVEAELLRLGLAGGPRPAGAALVFTADSRALAWLRDAARDGATWPHRFAGYQARHGTWERSTRAWLRLFEDAGHLPGALPAGEVGAATAARFPLLVANHVEVLDEGELAGLAAFLEAGGRLLVEGRLGTLDGSARRRPEPPLDSLRRIRPGRVLDPPPGLSRYLRARSPGAADAPTRGARACVAAARGWLGEAGVEDAPYDVEAEPALPWLRAQRRAAGGEAWVVALLANLASEAERRSLAETTIRGRVRPRPGWELVRLHPRGGPDAGAGGDFALPAHEPLVFVLRPSE